MLNMDRISTMDFTTPWARREALKNGPSELARMKRSWQEMETRIYALLVRGRKFYALYRMITETFLENSLPEKCDIDIQQYIIQLPAKRRDDFTSLKARWTENGCLFDSISRMTEGKHAYTSSQDLFTTVQKIIHNLGELYSTERQTEIASKLSKTIMEDMELKEFANRQGALKQLRSGLYNSILKEKDLNKKFEELDCLLDKYKKMVENFLSDRLGEALDLTELTETTTLHSLSIGHRGSIFTLESFQQRDVEYFPFEQHVLGLAAYSTEQPVSEIHPGEAL